MVIEMEFNKKGFFLNPLLRASIILNDLKINCFIFFCISIKIYNQHKFKMSSKDATLTTLKLLRLLCTFT